jgi:predicted DCC family thiol-disulfide oxidoreductase YuxK
MRPDPPPLLVLFDGRCGLCQGSVGWLLRRDRHRRLRFAPLQGTTAAPWRPAAGAALDTLVVVSGGGAGARVLVRSAAALAALTTLGGGWALLAALLGLVSRPLADTLYRAVARLRHRLGGPVRELPDPGDGRFLP